jgi:hypothetical protein
MIFKYTKNNHSVHRDFTENSEVVMERTEYYL